MKLKKIFFLAALAGASALPIAAQAAENYTLVLSGGKAYKSTDGGSTLGEVVSRSDLSYADGTWTMNGFNFETTAKTAVKVDDNVTIEVSGSNSISNKTTSAYKSYGLYFDAGGTINGDGTLTVSCETETGLGEGNVAWGIFNRTESDVVMGGSVTIVSSAKGDDATVAASGYSNANGTLTVQDSAVFTLSASTVSTSRPANGLEAITVVVKDKARITASVSGGNVAKAVVSASSSEPDAVATDTSSGVALTWNSETYYKGSDIATDVTLKAKPVPVAEVTKGGVTTQYTTLPAAFEAIGENGTGTVKLLADIDLGVNGVAYVPTGSDFTLDLNGKRIFQTEDEDLAPITYRSGTNGKLTINDSVGGGGITVNRASSAAAETNLNLHAVCCGGANGTLTVNGGTFAVTNNCGSAVIFYKEGDGIWTFNGGTHLAGGEGSCLAQFLHCAGSAGKTFVTGGTYAIEAKNAAGNGIYVANGGTEQIEITGGDFDVVTKADWTPAFEFYGTCVVKGGTFNVTSRATGAIGFNVKAGGLLIVSNGTFSVSAANNAANCLNATADSRLEVAGGTFSAASGAAEGYTACATIKGNQGGSIVITGTPVINQPTGDRTDNFTISIAGAWLDFTGYASASLAKVFVSNDGNTGFVKGDMSKCGWLSTSGGHFSTRPLEGQYWCADDMRPVVNLDEETKAEYPWVIGTAIAELVPGSGANYTCIADALTAAGDGETVKLLVDVTENVMITASQTNTLDLAGHVLKGADTGTAPVILINSPDAAITIRDTSTGHTGAITTGGAVYAGNGAGINVLKGSLSLYDITITNCVSSVNGGAIYGESNVRILLKNCLVKDNCAQGNGGGICVAGGELAYGIEPDDKLVLVSTEISGNRAGAFGAGVWFGKTLKGEACLAAGTRITMADGTTKAVESIEEGDVVRTFDHEGGTNSSARVFLVYPGETKAVPFTLWFDDGAVARERAPLPNASGTTVGASVPLARTLSIVDRHDLLLKDTRKYVTITGANVGQYIGAKFYGEDGAWHTLTNATMGTEAVEYYSLYSEQHLNMYANGLLTVSDVVDDVLNIYELDANLKADPDRLAADIAQYGLCSYDEAAAHGMSREWYDNAGAKYMNIAVGKQLVSWTYVESLCAAAQGSTSTVSTPASNVPCLASLATAPLLAAAGVAPTLDTAAVGVLTLGADVIVTNNVLAGGGANNIYLAEIDATHSLIALTDSHDGVCAGVSCSWGVGQFTTTDNVSASDVALFTSDNAAYIVEYDGACLVLSVPVVSFVPSSVDHTSAAVYVNDSPVEKLGDAYVITSNATATVVYTAEAGYFFADGSTAKTNEVTTSTNPATAEAPATPVKLIKYVAPVYVDNIASNGIAYWTTNTLYNYTVVTSAAARVTWGTAGATSWYVVTNGTYQIDGGVACTGDVHLVLCDGAKLTVANVTNSYAGIATDASGSFTIYETDPGDAVSSPRQVGFLDVTGDSYAAGIGGNFTEDGSNITINGGIVTARSGEADEAGAGIGGGSYGDGSNITINGGTVTAMSGDLGAGIGGGYDCDGLNITINDGTVTATGGVFSAGIGGGGEGGGGERITINGGKVTATGGDGAAGIGGGSRGGGSDIAIRGGVVTAIGGLLSPGIGGGGEGTGGENVRIANAVVFVGTTDATRDEGEGPCRYSADLIGGGALAGESSSGIVIDETAQVFFNLTGLWDYDNEEWIEEAVPMPEAFAGFVIMTPATQTVDRVLVGGCGGQGLAALPAFTLRKPAQERTKEIVIDGESVPFANAMLTLTNDVTASVLKLTAAELPDETTVTGQSGEEVKIVAEDDRLEELGIQKEDMVDTKNVQTNGLKTWQSYVLGLDPTNRLSGIYADAPQNAKADKVTIETKEFAASEIAPGFGLQYRLERQEAGFTPMTQNTASFEVDIAGDDPTGHYKLSVVITSNNVELAETAEAINVVGMVKQTQAATNAIISVPWGRLAPGEDQEIAVSNVVKTATLDAGDMLIVYRPGATSYEAWQLTSAKTWEPVTTASQQGAQEAGAPEAATIPRGSGIWLCRKDPSQPYYLYGQSNGEENAVPLEKGPNLVGATGLGAWDLNAHVTGAQYGDQIVVPGTNDVPKVFTFKDGKWGYWKTLPGKKVVFQGEERTISQTVWSTDDATIPAGTGFWLHNNSGKVEVK